MGYTFAAALVKRTGTAPSARKAIREGFQRMGFVRADPEEASIVLPLYHDKKSAWMTIGLEIPEDLGGQLEQLKQLSAEMHTPILYFMNFDSDFLYVAATDGEKVQHVHVGFIDEDDDDPENAEAMTDSEDLSVFDALMADDAARTEFRRIFAVNDAERIFSEDAAQEMAVLFGYTPEALFVDEDAEPFAVLGFEAAHVSFAGKREFGSAAGKRTGAPGGWDFDSLFAAMNDGQTPAMPLSTQLLMPEDAPPAFTKQAAILSVSNPSYMELLSCGGAGRGIRIVLQALNYDAQDWNVPVVAVTRSEAEPRTRTLMDYSRAVPQRVQFADGTRGWQVEIPDVEILPGVNPAHPRAMSRQSTEYHATHALRLHVAFVGAAVPRRTGLDNAMECMTRIFVTPVENPDGFVSFDLPCRAFRPRAQDEVWLRGYIDQQE